MPHQKQDSAIFRPDLGQAVMEYYLTPMEGYIGLQVMPIFRTAVNSGTYPVVPKEALLDIPDVDRAPRAAYSRDDYQLERGQFVTTEKGTEEPLDDTERELFDLEAPGTAEMVATYRAYMKIMRAQEKRIADIFDTAANFATHNAGGGVWSAYTTATPISDVEAGKRAFKAQCGMMPNTLIMNDVVLSHARLCDQVVDRLKYTYPGIDLNNITAAQLAQLFGVPRVLVAGGSYNSSGKGVAASISDIWTSKKIWLAITNNTMDLRSPCVGRTFLWVADSPTNPIVEEYRENQIRSDVYRVRHHVSEELIASKNKSGTVVSNVSALVCYCISAITS